MDYIYLALGCNLGNKKENLETAIKKLQSNGVEITEISPIYTTPALMFKNSPSEWNIPFLNCVIKTKTEKDPYELLKTIKQIEKEMGRDPSKRWSPRPIDIDILYYKDKKINSDTLTIPHKEIKNRSFVMDPLSFVYPEKDYYKNGHQPVFMGILNITPDSFSDGGKYNDIEEFKKIFELWQNNDVAIIDIGAESTKPDTSPLTDNEELKRLEIVFDYIKNRQKNIFNSCLSIDTYHYKTAEKAIESGFNIINDVSGFADNNMIQLAKEHNDIKFIFMHNLGIPSDKKITVNGNIIDEIKKWLENKIEIFEKNNLNKNNLIFDVGIGFGKTPSQDLQLLQNLSEFHQYGFKILVGHSRKSFIKVFNNDEKAINRDIESIAISMQIAQNVDIIRTHAPLEHQRALIAKDHCYNQFV